MFTMDSTKRVDTIRVYDDSEYVPELGNNGGAYRYWTKFTRTADDVWNVTEHTSGEFCPHCGSWDCSGECSEPEQIGTNELLDFLNNFVEDEDHYIEME